MPGDLPLPRSRVGDAVDLPVTPKSSDLLPPSAMSKPSAARPRFRSSRTAAARLGMRLANRLANWPHFLLAGHLLMLHVLAFGGWQAPAMRLLWVAALGLFLIWQPFVAG